MKKLCALALAPLIIVSIAACSQEPLTAHDLWSEVRESSAMEVEPARSLDDLVDESTLIVRARIDRITSGPDLVLAPEGEEVRLPSLIFHLDVVESQAGTAPTTLKVHIQDYGEELRPTDMPPQDEYVWFLKPSGIEDFYMTSKFAGVIGELDGEITTVSDSSDGVVENDWDALDDVEADIAEISSE